MKSMNAAALLLSLSLVATLAFAQAQTTPIEPREPDAVPTIVQGDRATAAPRAREDADARACLDFVTNLGVIRCAEKYRHPPQQRPAH
jgi:hypothetical protein